MIWLAGDVLLHGFLALLDGLLNFLFGGCFLSRFAFGDQPRQVPPDPRLSTLIRSHPNRR
jgi:hypothetical protein